ncbi:molybdopterin converting factor subunit 1 [Oceanobacillus salinisoli]|uniref:molybdopterin converting factor subunit 1 n=1 Tax=Oceanobacillus salinisoli TaxID=2678611 RepID=UPI0012E14241|nr:molybdopterin converting factor subunit 1 [Oceanobacillus salinisoli]
MIKVLLFAHLQEEAGKDQINYDRESITVKELKTSLQNDFGLAELEQVMTAINEEYAMDEDMVKSGDTVAFIPPVSGG